MKDPNVKAMKAVLTEAAERLANGTERFTCTAVLHAGKVRCRDWYKQVSGWWARLFRDIQVVDFVIYEDLKLVADNHEARLMWLAMLIAYLDAEGQGDIPFKLPEICQPNH